MQNKYFKILFIVCLICSISIAKGQRMTIKMADRYFKDFAFVDAIELYEYAYRKDTTNAHVVRQIAECYRNIGKTEKVEFWLKKLINRGNENADDLFNFSQALKSNGKYTEAQSWLEKYAQMRPEDGRVNMQVSLLEYIKFLKRDSTRFQVRPTGINTPLSEFGPAYYKDNIVFSSNRENSLIVQRKNRWDDKPFLDLYIARIDESGDLLSPKHFAPKIKSKYHEGPVAFNRSGTTMYLTKNNVYQGKARTSKEGITNLKIYVAKEVDGNWQVRYGLPFNSNEYSVGHASIDKTGRTLYFTSDMPGGYGGSDLYFSVYSNGKWSEPFNLGPKVNTEGNEMFPYISDEGVLYFASNGHGGLGGLDLYMATPERGVFTRIENLGYPVNSSKDDFGLVLNLDGTEGYFSSNRNGGKGLDDIYHLIIKRIPIIIKGVVRDRITNEEIADAKITLVNSNGDEIKSEFSKLDGLFEFVVNKGNDYTLKVEKADYISNERPLSTKALRPNSEVFTEIFIEQDFEMVADEDNLPEPLQIEEEDGEALQVLMLEYINYDLNKTNIRDDAAEVLDRLAALLTEYPDLEIRLESHTDSRGSDEYNMLLSKRRARAAFEYLVSKGIDPMRVRYEGFGETQLINHCEDGVDCSEEEHEVNRRTIVKAVRKGEYKSKRTKRSIFYF
jgi:outer membrane protein OmpA-like peptidoglycan-associated protein